MPDETLLDDSVIDIPGLLRLIDESWHPGLFGIARDFYRGTVFRFRQLIWADRNW
ncbi:MAG TPA: DUF4262 domain-containing protein [Micromonosporaceae bacterium]